MQITKIEAPDGFSFELMQKMNNENKVSKKTPRVRIQSVDAQGNLQLYWVDISGTPKMTLAELNTIVSAGHCVITNITVLKDYFKFTSRNNTNTKVNTQNLDIDGLITYCNKVKQQVGKGYGMTVAELTLNCLDAISKGHAKKRIFISNDDEGNGFHGLIYPFITSKNDICNVDSLNDVPHDGSAIILG